LLKPAYAADRLSLIRKLAPKLAVLSGSELKEALDLLYKNQRVSGLEVLLPYIRQPLTDDEIKAVLALFYASEVPRAVSLITSSRESGGVTN
jgi:cytochrome c553